MKRLAALVAALAALAVPSTMIGSPTKSATLDFSVASTTCANGGSISFSWSGYGGPSYVEVTVWDYSEIVDGQPTVAFEQFSTSTHGASSTYGPFTFDLINGHQYLALGFLTQHKPGGSVRVDSGNTTVVPTCS